MWWGEFSLKHFLIDVQLSSPISICLKIYCSSYLHTHFVRRLTQSPTILILLRKDKTDIFLVFWSLLFFIIAFLSNFSPSWQGWKWPSEIVKPNHFANIWNFAIRQIYFFAQQEFTHFLKGFLHFGGTSSHFLFWL